MRIEFNGLNIANLKSCKFSLSFFTLFFFTFVTFFIIFSFHSAISLDHKKKLLNFLYYWYWLLMLWSLKKNSLHNSWSKTRIFAASTIMQYWLDNTIIIIFFSDNETIIYWMKETNSYFLRIASKAPVKDLTEFIHSIWMDMTKQPTKFHFFLTSASWENED